MRSVPLPFFQITFLWTRAREPGPVSPVKVDSPLPFPWTQRGEIYNKVYFILVPIGQYVLFSSTNWNLLLRQTESFKRYRLPTNISASIVKVFSFLKSISVLSTWKSSGVMSAKILISSNGISYDSETLFW